MPRSGIALWLWLEAEWVRVEIRFRFGFSACEAEGLTVRREHLEETRKLKSPHQENSHLTIYPRHVYVPNGIYQIFPSFSFYRNAADLREAVV